jgi:hypothetical protein
LSLLLLALLNMLQIVTAISVNVGSEQYLSSAPWKVPHIYCLRPEQGSHQYRRLAGLARNIYLPPISPSGTRKSRSDASSVVSSLVRLQVVTPLTPMAQLFARYLFLDFSISWEHICNNNGFRMHSKIKRVYKCTLIDELCVGLPTALTCECSTFDPHTCAYAFLVARGIYSIFKITVTDKSENLFPPTSRIFSCYTEEASTSKG